jgi:hypothetical protein
MWGERNGKRRTLRETSKGINRSMFVLVTPLNYGRYNVKKPRNKFNLELFRISMYYHRFPNIREMPV